MAAGNKPDYNAFVSVKGKDDKPFYTKIGAGWNVNSDGISIKLNSLPIGGELVLFPFRDQD